MTKAASIGGNRDMLAAERDFFAASFSSAAVRLRKIVASDGAAFHAVVLLARIELKSDPAGALALLAARASAFRSPRQRGEAALLRAIAYVRLGDRRSAKAHFDIAQKLIERDPTLGAEFVYQRAGAAWIERRLPAARKLLESLPQELDPDFDLQVRILRGAVASASEDLAAQGAILLEARAIAGRAGTLARGVLVSQLASLAAELPSDELRDAANADVRDVAWTADIGNLQFETLRSLAWRHALDGDEFNAFRRLKEAIAATPSPAWRVAALADRGYLASALGERRWAAQERRDARELAATVDWAALDGEEKLALPQLAELFAASDPTVALGYISTFLAVGKTYARVLSSSNDRRIDALEAYSLGRVHAALGEREEALRLLRRAYDIYRSFGIAWRAARAALALSELEDRDRWRAIAAASLAAYPRSWLARGLVPFPNGMSATPSPFLEKLTPAQRTVCELLLEGTSTQDIADRLGRSSFTVRNHIKAIFKAFDVTSRPALLAKATRYSGL